MNTHNVKVMILFIGLGLLLIVLFIPFKATTSRFSVASPSLALSLYTRIQSFVASRTGGQGQTTAQGGMGICGPQGCGASSINRQNISITLSSQEATELAIKLKPVFIPLTTISVLFTQDNITASTFSLIPGYSGSITVSGPIRANRWQLEKGTLGDRALSPQELSKFTAWFNSLQDRFLEAQQSELYSAVIQGNSLILSGAAPPERIRIEVDGRISLNLAPL